MKFLSYQDCLNYLFSRDQFTIKLGLENIKRLLRNRGNPENNQIIIHTAGTNGKGSICGYICQILKYEGFKNIGLFTSPHLVSFRERILINNSPISCEYIRNWLNSAYDILNEINATYFECVTAMALEYFKSRNCDVTVLETGMGGRLDATNSVTPKISVISPVSMDHTYYLGGTIEEIWKEKVAISKPGLPVVINETRPRLLEILDDHIKSGDNRIININDLSGIQIEDRSRGEESDTIKLNGIYGFYKVSGNFRYRKYQAENLYQAAISAETFLGHKLKLNENTPAPTLKEPHARQQILSHPEKVTVILDGAHNEAGIDALFNYIRGDFSNFKKTMVFSVMKDKNYKRFIQKIDTMEAKKIFVHLDQYPRSIDFENLSKLYTPNNNPWSNLVLSPKAIKNLISSHNSKNEVLIFFGSLYLMGEIIPLLSDHYPGLEFFKQFQDE